eukprot:TRINITY_DN2831_c0_g3_i2.p1 TRINITY_DN2831_c0_g3~~TRINITY_DN2831_c0_g3_i2.p1  ORF type:complete len:493 (+),score=147.56 TRINITY_DN2831_c0_g3_i2:92-1570(+)
MIRRPPRSTLSSSSAASDVYKRQEYGGRHRRAMTIVHGGHDYELGETIARTTHGKVKSAVNLSTQEHVAVKMIKRQDTPQARDSYHREVEIMAALEHPNLIQLCDYFCDKQWRYIVMESASGDLFDHLLTAGRLSEAEARRHFEQIVHAIAHCHERGIAHRDLKPENVLLSDQGTVKVCDFGLAQRFSTPDSQQEQLLTTVCGTEKYAAPELLAVPRQPYSGVGLDLWCLGVLLYVLVSGGFPFDKADTQCERYVAWAGGSSAITAQLSPELQALLRGLLAVDPAQRLSLETVLSCAWMRPPPAYTAAVQQDQDDWELVERPKGELEVQLVLCGAGEQGMQQVASLLSRRGFDVQRSTAHEGGLQQLKVNSNDLELRFKAVEGSSTVTVTRLSGEILEYHRVLHSLQQSLCWRQKTSSDDGPEASTLAQCGAWGGVQLSGTSVLGMRLWRRRYAVVQGDWMFFFKDKHAGQEGVVLALDLRHCEVQVNDHAR